MTKMTNKQRCKNCAHKCVCVYQDYYENLEGIEKCKNYIGKKKKAKEIEGCEYCAGESKLYQHTYNTKLYINTFGRARTIETECMPCPPYSKCCMNGIPARSAFIINYCPHCGRKLD